MILPAKQIEYNSIVIEKKTTYCVNQTPLHCIKATCEKNWSSYEARRDAIMKRTNFKYKIPMMLSKLQMLFAFPTTGTDQFACAWIFLHNIASIHHEGATSAVTFHNGQKVMLDISYHILTSQLQRTQSLYENVTRTNFD